MQISEKQTQNFGVHENSRPDQAHQMKVGVADQVKSMAVFAGIQRNSTKPTARK